MRRLRQMSCATIAIFDDLTSRASLCRILLAFESDSRCHAADASPIDTRMDQCSLSTFTSRAGFIQEEEECD